jgi:hypothetical protein
MPRRVRSQRLNVRLHFRTATDQGRRFAKFGNRFVTPFLMSVRKTKRAVARGKVRVHLNQLLQFFDCAVVLAKKHNTSPQVMLMGNESGSSICACRAS